MSQYYSLANYYDSFTGNVDYGRRADFLVRYFTDTNAILLDAGCGTGTISKLLMDKGYDVIGVDNSPEMLMNARNKNPSQMLLLQDLTELDLYGTVQGAFCLQDTLNHLSSIEDVDAAIERISLFLESVCFFIFDINTLYKHSCVLSNNTFIYQNEAAFCIWQNTYHPDNGAVDIDLDVFSRIGNSQRYERCSESFREILIPSDTLDNLLVIHDLSLEQILDGDTLKEVNDKTQRLLYVTRKN